MWRDALRTVAIALRAFLLCNVLVAGTALTVAAAWFCFQYGLPCFTRGCQGGGLHVTAWIRASVARRAIERFVSERGKCPSSEDELVGGVYMHAYSTIDPWGTPLLYHCDLRDGDHSSWATSAGPDRVFWTADDITSKEQEPGGHDDSSSPDH
jgi:hypothetical protein